MRYFTKDWYELMQKCGRAYGPKEAELRKRLDAVSAAFRQDLSQQNLPKGMWNKFCFHDGKILDVQAGEDYEDCIIRVDSPFTAYNKVTFCSALVKQDNIPVGAVWLYEELYRHTLGYEAHILCCGRDGLLDTKIVCRDILFEEESQ